MQYSNNNSEVSEENSAPLDDSKNIKIEIEIEEDTEYNGDEQSFEKEDELKSSRFKDGEILNMVRVRFPGNAKSFPFFVGKRRFAYGQKVVAMSDRGMTVGYINSFTYEIEFNKSMLPIRSIAKVASEVDIKEQKDFRDSEKKAEVICLHLIERHRLDMILTHVEFIQFGKKAVFYFNAPERVDFRELVKDLVGELKMRIELRQISVRDRAAALGAIGACGLQTCCSSFLKNYGNVSIKMAKNQNLALIPSKLNGVCGQIKCCIKYEDDVYADKRKNLPREQSFIKAKNGDIGKVLRLHLLVEQFELLTDFGAKRRYAGNQFIGDDNLPENYKFPETFDHIVDETKEVIGLLKEEQKRSERFTEQLGDSEDELENENDYDNDSDDEGEFDSAAETPVVVENKPQHNNRPQGHNRGPNQNNNNNNRPPQHNRGPNNNNNRPNNNRGPNNNNNNRPNNNNNRPHHNNNRPNQNQNQNQNRNPNQGNNPNNNKKS
jgi:cell fate regulator YaaT (PSP1 superfamily)